MVTGGSGFIGFCLIERLLEEGYEVLSFDLKPVSRQRNVEHCGLEEVVGDIKNFKRVREAVETCGYVYHLAAVANLDFARTHPQVAIDTNIRGTFNVASCCSRLGVPLAFASTCCVYGDTPNHPSNEESFCVPTDIYGSTKMVAENIIKDLHRLNGLDYSILRLGTTYGPHMRKELAIYIFIEQALNNKPLTIHGSGKQTRCFIYIDDLVDGLVNVLKKGVSGETLNLATEEELSILEVADMVLEETGRQRGCFKFVEDRPGQIMKEQIDISKARKLLNWSPKVPFREGLRKTVEWVQSRLRL